MDAAAQFEQSLSDFLMGPNSIMSNQQMQLLVILLVGKYALRSSALDAIFGNFMGSALLTWVACFYVLRNVRQASMYAAILVIGTMVLEKFMGYEGFDIENRNIHPTCMNATYESILANFDGDKERLRRAMFNAVNTNFTSAPLSATQLSSYGYSMGDCKVAPNDADATNEVRA